VDDKKYPMMSQTIIIISCFPIASMPNQHDIIDIQNVIFHVEGHRIFYKDEGHIFEPKRRLKNGSNKQRFD
jgi:hypothetical protein